MTTSEKLRDFKQLRKLNQEIVKSGGKRRDIISHEIFINSCTKYIKKIRNTNNIYKDLIPIVRLSNRFLEKKLKVKFYYKNKKKLDLLFSKYSLIEKILRNKLKESELRELNEKQSYDKLACLRS